MSAEMLREAARLMRERAHRSADSPWYYREEVATLLGHAPHTYVRHSVYATDADDGRNTPYVVEANNPLDAGHIASWHPAVALAVADLIECIADQWDEWQPPPEVAAQWIQAQRALAVARAYLGEQP